MTTKENPYDRELTKIELKIAEDMMAANPLIDFVLAETLIKMPKNEIEEIIEAHKKGELKEPEDLRNQKPEGGVVKCGYVEDAPEHKPNLMELVKE